MLLKGICWLALVLVMPCITARAAEKPRVFILTDIENEPDDAMSMVRFLTYANQFDIEGLAATTSVQPSARLPHWWTDDPAANLAEGSHSGAKTVNRWREEFLGDFPNRLLRCQSPALTVTTR
jgi:hypothetical protein